MKSAFTGVSLLNNSISRSRAEFDVDDVCGFGLTKSIAGDSFAPLASDCNTAATNKTHGLGSCG